MSQVPDLTERLRQAQERAKTLEEAVRSAAEWGWCRESREILWGAVLDDPERIQKAMDSSSGLVAEAIQCLQFWEALGEVREAAQALVAQELMRRKGLRGSLKRVDWEHLIDRLGRCRLEDEETDAEALLASKPLTILDPDSPDDDPECGLCGGEVDEHGDCVDQCEPGANTQSRWQLTPAGKRALHP